LAIVNAFAAPVFLPVSTRRYLPGSVAMIEALAGEFASALIAAASC
jgi:hypothetical protein